MKITFLLLSIERSGGVRVTIAIANQLSLMGHKCVLLAIGDKEIPFNVEDKLEIIKVNKRTTNSQIDVLYSVFDLALRVPNDTDIIVSSYYLTAYAAFLAKFRILKCKVFYIIQGYEPNYFKQENTKTKWLSYTLARFSYYLPLKKSAISKWLSNIISSKNRNPIHVINNGIDSDFFKPMHKLNNTNVLMTNANNRPNRGFFDFCEAVNLLWKIRTDFKLLIVGNDVDIVKGLKMPVEFITPKDDFELIKAYNRATIYITCSHEEGFGLTPLEAMSCGTAVVCTDSGGIRDYAIHDENCLMTPIKDIKQIADSINKLLEDEALKKRLIQNGRKTAMNFDWINIGRQYEKFFLK